MEFLEPEKRFRAEVYVDIWVADTGDHEQTRKNAKDYIKGIIDGIPNAYLADIKEPKATDYDK